MINREKFFDSVKNSLFKGKLKQSQVDGINFLLDAFDARPELVIPEIAYMLATVYHETGLFEKVGDKKVFVRTMLPVEEYGKGKGRRYGSNIDIDGSRYKGLPHVYYGRGYVQLTWLTNYVKATEKLCIDFVNNPSLALDPVNAAKIMIVGMQEGWFTGRKLAHYFAHSKKDYLNARRIINGTDKMQLIADYANKFESALR